MSRRKVTIEDCDTAFPLDGQQIERDLDELLAKIEPDIERTFAELPASEPESIDEMHARHAAEGRMLQQAGLKYFAQKAQRERRRTCA